MSWVALRKQPHCHIVQSQPADYFELLMSKLEVIYQKWEFPSKANYRTERNIFLCRIRGLEGVNFYLVIFKILNALTHSQKQSPRLQDHGHSEATQARQRENSYQPWECERSSPHFPALLPLPHTCTYNTHCLLYTRVWENTTSLSTITSHSRNIVIKERC